MDTTAVAMRDVAEAARLARTSLVADRAVALAKWVGTGSYPVTAGGVLRKADTPAAGAAIGVAVPSRLRTMADLRSLSRPWQVGVACGLLSVSGGAVTAGPALAHWPPDDSALLDGWLTALRAVCAAESFPQDGDSVLMLVMSLLTVLGDSSPPAGAAVWDQVFEALPDLCDRYDKSHRDSRWAADRYGDADDGNAMPRLTAMLAGFGAVQEGPAGPLITPLGRWALARLAAALPGLADPGLPLAEMIAAAARFTDDAQQRNHVAWGWLGERDWPEAVREVLAAAEDMSALHRTVAVGVLQQLGDSTIPAWREYLSAPNVGPHAREVLGRWTGEPDPEIADEDWLVTEAAAAALQSKGPDAALTIIFEDFPGPDLETCLIAVAATGHPDAAVLWREVAEFAASGAPCAIRQVAELKISLSGFRPPVWRRVLVPVTIPLAGLHELIRLLFGWDDDHLHVFKAGRKHYSDPFTLSGLWDAGQTGLEDEVRLDEVLAAGGKFTYTYDLGANREHEIVLERILTRDPDATYPVCTASKGGRPVPYWSEEDEVDFEEPEPIDLDRVNARLAALARREE